jgi:DNA-binding MarR family transcriptional regulator
VAEPGNWYDGWPTGVLLGMARQTYNVAVRRALTEAGFDDLPRNGPFVVGAIARTGNPLSQVIQHLGVSKQATGQLVDTLVARGYLDRTVDQDDRRRLTITLTDRGRAAATVVRAAVDDVDARLVQRVGLEQFSLTLAALAALIDDGPAAAARPGS